MTDIRLTALNPENSQVYPVACNSSGELVVAKDIGPDVDIDGNLDVTGTGSFGGSLTSGHITITAESSSAAKVFDVKAFGSNDEVVAIQSNGSSTFNGVLAVERSNSGDGCFHAKLNGEVKASIASDGSATFAGNVTAANINTFRSRLSEAALSAGSVEDLKTAILNALESL